MTTWLTADPHFGHARILELCERPFLDVDEMNQTIILNFNERAGSDDRILLLGDACMGKLNDNLPLINLIDASVTLYVGNHDRPSRAMQHKGDVTAKIEKMRDKYLEYFDDVILDADDHVVKLQGRSFALSHYPYVGDHSDEDRFTKLRPKNRGLPLLHGHVHNAWKTNGRQFNVGVDVNDFKLVHEDEITAWAARL